jgi:hypothetical protein
MPSYIHPSRRRRLTTKAPDFVVRSAGAGAPVVGGVNMRLEIRTFEWLFGDVNLNALVAYRGGATSVTHTVK